MTDNNQTVRQILYFVTLIINKFWILNAEIHKILTALDVTIM